MAHRALSDDPDVFFFDTEHCESVPDHAFKIEHELVVRAFFFCDGSVVLLRFFADQGGHRIDDLASDFEAAFFYRGTDGDTYVGGIGSEACERINGVLLNIRNGAAPSAVHGTDHTFYGVLHQHRNTVRGKDRKRYIRKGCHISVALVHLTFSVRGTKIGSVGDMNLVAVYLLSAHKILLVYTGRFEKPSPVFGHARGLVAPVHPEIESGEHPVTDAPTPRGESVRTCYERRMQSIDIGRKILMPDQFIAFVFDDHVDPLTPFKQRPDEISVAFPCRKAEYLIGGNPCKLAFFAAFPESAGKSRCRIQIHILIVPCIRNKLDNAVKVILCQRQSGLLIHFADHAFIRALAVLELAADTDPFAFVKVVLLRDPVQQEIFVVVISDVTKCSVHVV